MGCASSKLDDLPAVALCRERCAFLDEAIHQRFILAQAHMAYIHSLRRIGNSLHDFMKQDFGASGVTVAASSSSPKLNLPPQRKGDPVSFSDGGEGGHSHSNSGSHLHFHSDSDEDEEDDDSVLHLHHSDDHSSPLHGGGGGHIEYMSADYMNNSDQGFFGGGGGGGGGGGFLHMNYMKNKTTTPSVVYEQRPMSSETVHFGESSASAASSYYYPNPNNPYPMNNNPSYFGYQSYGYGGGGGGGGDGGGAGGYYGYPPPPPYRSLSPPQAVASSSKPPPPPPSPPRASPWDFLNPFENYEKFYTGYTPSRDSKELREEEGIPDLEEENDQNEVVKEVHGNQKYVDGGGKSAIMDDGDGVVEAGAEAEASLYQARPSVPVGNDDRVEFEAHVVKKKMLDNERSEERSGNSAGGGRGGLRDASQVAVQIKIQFERASECGNEIAKMLEVGCVPYQRKHSGFQKHYSICSILLVLSF